MGILSKIFNFDNIGTKIKNLTKWSCWVTILLIWIAAPITFIVLIADDWTAYLCWIPLVGAVVGSILVWIESWLLYAFGELAEDVHAIRCNPSINSIDKNIQLIAEPYAKREAEEKAKREAEERAKREAEERAKSAAEAKAKREAEERAKSAAEAKAKREAKESDNREKKNEKSLVEHLEYALRYETDRGMIDYLKNINDATVQKIIQYPEPLVREHILNYLDQLQ